MGFVDVGHDRDAKFRADFSENLDAFFEPRAAETVVGRAIRLVKGGLKDIWYAEAICDLLDAAANVKRAFQSL